MVGDNNWWWNKLKCVSPSLNIAIQPISESLKITTTKWKWILFEYYMVSIVNLCMYVCKYVYICIYVCIYVCIGWLVLCLHRSMACIITASCSHQLASAEEKREAYSVSPPLLVIASIIDQTFSVPPGGTNRPLGSNDLRQSCKESKRRKTLIPNQGRQGSLSFFKQTCLWEGKLHFQTGACSAC